MGKRIGIFGGAFNPPTRGHSHVIKAVLRANLVDEIWVIPSYVHFHGKNMTEFDHRVEMCVNAFSKDTKFKFNPSRVKVMQVEKTFHEIDPLYDGSMISFMNKLHKISDNDYYIIIGEDNADSMHTWNHGNDLILRERFIVIPRPSNDVHNRDAMWYEYPPHVFLKNVKMLDISSTYIRSLFTREPYTIISDSNTKEIEKWIPTMVSYVIFSHALYTTKE